MVGLGFSLQAQYTSPLPRVVGLLQEAGFSAVSPVWTPAQDLDTLAVCVRARGMTVQSIHAPHKNISKLWEPDSELSRKVQEQIMRCIDDCARFGVPVMVMHGWQGLSYTPLEGPLDFRFFDRMVDYAQQKNVSVAFENLEGEEYLLALMTRYRKAPHVGYCWDSGHDFCYPHKLDFLKEFGDRLIMTHINDNLGLRDPKDIPSGNDDLHFLPYDGKINWNDALGRLKDLPKQSMLNFEIKVRSHSAAPSDLPYTQISLEEFIRTAGVRARGIAALYQQIMDGTV